MMSELVALPENVIMRVLSLLHYKDLLNVASTCHLLHGLALSDYQWIRLCEPWRVHVDLEKWRTGVDSARTVFRLLSSFSKLVGHWSAPGLEPRGGLLFVAWGHLSVLAYGILVLKPAELKMQHLFDVVGLPSYCTTTKVLTSCSTPAGQRGPNLSGALVWSSLCDEFYLKLTEDCEALLHDMKQVDAASRPETGFVVTDNNGGRIPSDALQFWHIKMSSHTPLDLGDRIMRRLIVEDARKEAPLAGLWAGLYGPHGMEFVNISYTSEEIVATKVVGDVNVPCGEITFKAKIATESSDISLHLQGIMNARDEGAVEPFIIVKMYEGCGQVADMGFRNPEWVRGKLLIAHENVIAFVWEDDEEPITYQKFHVPSLYDQQKDCSGISIQ